MSSSLIAASCLEEATKEDSQHSNYTTFFLYATQWEQEIVFVGSQYNMKSKLQVPVPVVLRLFLFSEYSGSLPTTSRNSYVWTNRFLIENNYKVLLGMYGY